MGVGISVLIGLKATVLFCMFAYLRALGLILLSIPFLYASLVALLVSVALLLARPSIFPCSWGRDLTKAFQFGPSFCLPRICILFSRSLPIVNARVYLLEDGLLHWIPRGSSGEETGRCKQEEKS
ncbi:hypothetical protein NE237_017865 [Protea cynaroides]|uniref:Transmembrane protein n=1 Tax=Protea cynaroides TaxID=273540 RepID=A0A9Q0K8Y3_9MAGN|nr:hypothetical protein NE237_017865 [Protea cynaroides]